MPSGFLVDAYLALRVSAMGFTLTLPLVGFARLQGEIPPPLAAVLLCIAVSFHVFAYVLNDLADLWVDRSEPLRADSPLVRGVLDARHALWLVVLQPPLAFALAWHAGCSWAGLCMLAGAFAGLLAYDLYGKRCRWPLLMDAVQALGWCALLMTGAFWHGAQAQAGLVWLVAYVLAYVLLVNGFHGGLRDLANDLACGARTTAIWFGARPGPASSVAIPAWFFAYVLALQLALIACVIAALGSSAGMADSAWRLLPIGLCIGAALLLAAATPSRPLARRRLLQIGAAHVVLALAVLPAMVLPMMNLAGVAVLGGAFALPVIAMYLYNGTHWRL